MYSYKNITLNYHMHQNDSVHSVNMT